MGTKFTVYDNGLNPMKSTTSLEASNLRQELAAICYVSINIQRMKCNGYPICNYATFNIMQKKRDVRLQ